MCGVDGWVGRGQRERGWAGGGSVRAASTSRLTTRRRRITAIAHLYRVARVILAVHHKQRARGDERQRGGAVVGGQKAWGWVGGWVRGVSGGEMGWEGLGRGRGGRPLPALN